LTITLIAVTAPQVIAITRKPSISPLALISGTENITPARIGNASTSPPFTPLLWFYVSGPYFPSYFRTANYGVSEINDEQTWSAFWSQVSENSLPQIDFRARTVLLTIAPIFPFGTFRFNATRVFKSDSPLPACVVWFYTSGDCALPPPPPTLHIQVDGRTEIPGPDCIFPAIVKPPRYLVEVVEAHKTDLPAVLVTTSVPVPC
jgi:hypothetical protein